MIFGNMGDMMKMARDMQKKLKDIKKELAMAIYEEFGNGVTVKVSGEMDIKEISLDPRMVDVNKVSNLQKEIQNTVNKCLKKAKDDAAKKLKGATGGLNLPGMF